MENPVSGRAAQYLRMSTEHQQYSIENQENAIQIYAALRGFEVVATYRDEGKSGLTLSGRPGLRKLIEEVESGSAKFDVVVVYDVSRWGRFQDTDESAYYEHRCKRAGVKIEYCAEPFVNDGSPLSAILKGLKRAMAGEYSRELSEKVWTAQMRIGAKGFKLGASPGYGFRRLVLDKSGARKMRLKPGERKNLQSDRVILVHGPKHELKWIRWIYDQYISGSSHREIVDQLNEMGIARQNGVAFEVGNIKEILTNEKYAGTLIWNRTSEKLKLKRVKNAPSQWLRVPNAIPAIVDRKTFEKAQAVRAARAKRLGDEDILAPLRKTLRKYGYLSIGLLDSLGTFPSPSVCQAHFGSMRATWAAVGCESVRDLDYVRVKRHHRSLFEGICSEILAALGQGKLDVEASSADRVVIARRFTLSIVICRYRHSKSVPRGWRILANGKQAVDMILAVRMDQSNQDVLDYVLLPLRLASALHFNLTEHKVGLVEGYRARDLTMLPAQVRKVCAELTA